MTHHPKKRPSRTVIVAGGVLCVIVGLGVGLIIGFLVDPSDNKSQKPRPDMRSDFQQATSRSKIRETLRELTQKPHVAGTDADLETAENIKSRWLEHGVDKVFLVPYKVLLQYPPEDENQANRAQIIDKDGTTVFETALKSDHLGEEVLMQEGIPAPYSAYSATGDVTGDLVYVNFCTLDDLEHLRTALLPGVNLTGKIFISRIGGTGRSTKVKNAQEAGAAALLLYSDPADYSVDPTIGSAYPDGPFLPPSGVQRGSIIQGFGDPLTPGYPATEGAFRLEEDDANLPKIPVHPINYEDAANLLRRLTGPRPPSGWRGSLEGTDYEVGPGFKDEDVDRSVRVVVNSYSELRTAYNVIGFIHGEIEPDRYVIIGNHRDAWAMGAVDPTSGTATLLEITRILGGMKKNGWRPRRTMVFGSWGAEEFGLIGSIEWTEEYYHLLSSRAVAYLNLDIAVAGNWVFRPSASPHFSPIVIEAMKNILEPNPTQPGQTIYDSYLEKENYDPDTLTEQFIIRRIGTGSDYYGFLYGVGVPCISGYYYYDRERYPTSFYSLYHTQYETFRLMDEFIDPGFVYHEVIARLFGDMLLNIADSVILPVNVNNYADYILVYYMGMAMNESSYRAQILEKGIVLEYFEDAIVEFNNATMKFQNEVLTSVDLDDPLAVRAVNDRIMFLERAFLDRNGLPGQPLERHTIFATAKSQNVPYDTTFPGIADAMENVASNESIEAWREVEKQVSILTYIIHSAASILKDDASWTEPMLRRKP